MDEKHAPSLYDQLLKFSAAGRVPFHMPGHQRAAFPWLGDAARIDFTEIEGLDNLHAPEGILRDASDRAARRWGADRSFLLTGGSTVGALAAIWTAAKGGRPLILARSCHRSVYHAAMLTGSPVMYIAPRLHPLGFALGITAADAEEAFEKSPDAAALVITSPTYDGVVSDVASIAAVCHRHGAVLIADAAHGAHLGFLDPSVLNPVRLGADLVFMSLHKTLPALTQTAVLHVNGSRIDPDGIAAALGIFETSSPSYPLLASADGCINAMGDDALFENWRACLARIRENARGLLVVPGSADDPYSADPADPGSGVFAFDASKLILAVPGMSGPDAAQILRRDFRIEPEMVSARYVLLMTGAGTNERHADALIAALRCLAERAVSDEGRTPPSLSGARADLPDARMTMGDAAARGSELIPLEDAAGRIGGEFLTAYPPGIPLLAPGEIIEGGLIHLVRRLAGDGIAVTTSRGTFDEGVRVLREL